jgi:hypothetical protein
VNARESDLTRFDPDSLPSQFLREPVAAEADSPSLASPRDSRSYFRTLLAIVLALLFIEPCLAWQFGRGRG